jgi:hypothetical protein
VQFGSFFALKLAFADSMRTKTKTEKNPPNPLTNFGAKQCLPNMSVQGARFLLTQYTKTGEKYTKGPQHYQMAIKYKPNGCELLQIDELQFVERRSVGVQFFFTAECRYYLTLPNLTLSLLVLSGQMNSIFSVIF